MEPAPVLQPAAPPKQVVSIVIPTAAQETDKQRKRRSLLDASGSSTKHDKSSAAAPAVAAAEDQASIADASSTTSLHRTLSRSSTASVLQPPASAASTRHRKQSRLPPLPQAASAKPRKGAKPGVTRSRSKMSNVNRTAAASAGRNVNARTRSGYGTASDRNQTGGSDDVQYWDQSTMKLYPQSPVGAGQWAQLHDGGQYYQQQQQQPLQHELLQELYDRTHHLHAGDNPSSTLDYDAAPYPGTQDCYGCDDPVCCEPSGHVAALQEMDIWNMLDLLQAPEPVCTSCAYSNVSFEMNGLNVQIDSASQQQQQHEPSCPHHPSQLQQQQHHYGQPLSSPLRQFSSAAPAADDDEALAFLFNESSLAAAATAGNKLPAFRSVAVPACLDQELKGTGVSSLPPLATDDAVANEVKADTGVSPAVPVVTMTHINAHITSPQPLATPSASSQWASRVSTPLSLIHI